jgi:uncharacterized protein YukE
MNIWNMDIDDLWHEISKFAVDTMYYGELLHEKSSYEKAIEDIDEKLEDFNSKYVEGSDTINMMMTAFESEDDSAEGSWKDDFDAAENSLDVHLTTIKNALVEAQTEAISAKQRVQNKLDDCNVRIANEGDSIRSVISGAMDALAAENSK